MLKDAPPLERCKGQGETVGPRNAPSLFGFFSFLTGLLLAFIPFLGAESVTQKILHRYGGVARLEQAQRFELTGYFLGAERGEDFFLRADGDDSRFETPSYVAIRDGKRAQAASSLEELPPARKGVIGVEDHLLLPVFLLSKLDLGAYRYKGLSGGLHRYEGEIRRDYYIGYEPPPVRVELAFDAEELLLRSARFVDRGEMSTDLALTYEDYEPVAGLPVARTVTRFADGKRLILLKITSVDLNPVFSDEELRLVEKGGR